jgi:hypothetical protein
MAMGAPEGIRTGGVRGDPGRKYWSGCVGATWWFYFTGESTNEVWEAYIAHCKAMLESGMDRPSLVCVCHRADSPTADQRRMLAEFISAEGKRLSKLVGFALVLDSPLHILALRAINWIVKKPFPETVCGSPSTAALWLVERGANIDPHTLANAFAEQIPSEHLWLV